MRLLLLLSAILSALTGVAGARAAVALPVAAASASASEQIARVEATATKVAGLFAPAPRVHTAVVHGVPLMALTLRRAYPLYADRRRE